MSVNLIELFKTTVSDVLVRQSSALLDESAESISSAVGKIFPALLNAMILKGSTVTGAEGMLDFMRTNNIDEALHDDVPSLLSGGSETANLTNDGAGILKYLFADKLSFLVDWVSSGNGLKTSSASTLLKIVAPLVMGAIARAVKEKSLSANGLMDLLHSQKQYVDASAPAAIAELVGIAPEPVKAEQIPLTTNSIDDHKDGSTLSKILPWLVLLIAALGLFYFLEKGGGPSSVDNDQLRKDSLENVRRIDSVEHVRKMDSIRNQTLIDSMNSAPPDTLNTNRADTLN